MKNKLLLILIISLFLFSAKTKAQPKLVLTEFTNGTAYGLTKPVCIANAGDSRLFIVSQDGIIWIVDSAGGFKSTPFLNIDSIVGSAGNEQGLLGLAFSPYYKTDGYFFVNYTDNSGNSHVSRYQVSPTNPDSAEANSQKLILYVAQPFSNHNGGNLCFGPDKYLYIGFGDGGSADDPFKNAQNKKKYLGKMLRIDPFGGNPYASPASNPFYSNAAYYPEIWAIGLRNPWRYSFDRLTGDLWIGDVGQNNYEEIDFQPASSTGGENYGWRCYEGDSAYLTSGCVSASNFTFPVHVYDHGQGCAITGGYVYRGANEGDLYGRYISTDYCTGIFLSTKPNGTGGWKVDTLQTFDQYAYTSFGENNKGELFATSHSLNRIMKITTEACLPTAHILSADTVNYCGPFLTLNAVAGTNFKYQWNVNGNPIGGATSATYDVNQTGNFSVLVTDTSACSALSNKVHVDFCTAVSEKNQFSHSTLYPNPATSTTTLEFYTPASGNFEIKLFNAIGMEMMNEQKEFPAGVNDWKLETSKLTKGFYFLNVRTGEKTFVKRLVVN